MGVEEVGLAKPQVESSAIKRASPPSPTRLRGITTPVESVLEILSAARVRAGIGPISAWLVGQATSPCK